MTHPLSHLPSTSPTWTLASESPPFLVLEMESSLSPLLQNLTGGVPVSRVCFTVWNKHQKNFILNMGSGSEGRGPHGSSPQPAAHSPTLSSRGTGSPLPGQAWEQQGLQSGQETLGQEVHGGHGLATPGLAMATCSLHTMLGAATQPHRASSCSSRCKRCHEDLNWGRN